MASPMLCILCIYSPKYAFHKYSYHIFIRHYMLVAFHLVCVCVECTKVISKKEGQDPCRYLVGNRIQLFG